MSAVDNTGDVSRRSWLCCATGGLLDASRATARSRAAPTPLPAQRVFADPDINGPDVHAVKLSPDGELVTFLKPKESDQTALDLWAAPVGHPGPAHMLVDSAPLERASLSDAERSRRERQRITQHGIVDYAWDEQGRLVLVPISGELHILDVGSGTLRTLVFRGPSGEDVTDSRFSPKGGFVSFVRNGAVWVMPPTGGKERRVTPIAEGAVTYGTAEFVAQEEFARDTGYWWSPDDEAIAYTRVDESSVEVITRVGYTPSGATVTSQRFPRAGGHNAIVVLYIQSLAGGPPIEIDLGADQDVYIGHIGWSKDGRTVFVQVQSRDQQTLELFAADPKTGASRRILTEHRTPWVRLNLDFTPLKGGDFLWVSERTGYAHLYLYDSNGNLIRAVTAGEFPLGGLDRVPSVAGVDELNGVAFVIASKDSPLEQHLYAVNFRSGGPMTKLTSGQGWWAITMGAAANAFVGRYSDSATPPRTGLYGADGQLRRWIVENRLDASHPYGPYRLGLPVPQFGLLTAEDGQTLNYILLKPTNFDPAKSYPVIVEVYGGPGRQKVTRAWRSAEERLWLEAGFIVFQLDNRGTANRGLKFEAPIWRQMGTPEVHDQIVGVRFLQGLPYVDPKRIGVMGWSYGGFMTWRLMTEPNAGFAAGAAGAAPADFRFYDTHYTEHYESTPQAALQAYDRTAILPRLPNLQGPILILHGMEDDNVSFSNATMLVAKLQADARPFEMMVYPGQRHGIIGERQKLHLFLTQLDFFKRKLGQPRRRKS